MQNAPFKKRAGVSLLIAVIIISAIALLLATTSGFIGIDTLQTGMRQDTALEAFAGTDGCMEIGLKKLRDNQSYTGETIILGDTSCTVTVTGSGTARTIKARALHAAAAYAREIEAAVDWSSVFKVTSWKELTE